jgi:hypothetical protein
MSCLLLLVGACGAHLTGGAEPDTRQDAAVADTALITDAAPPPDAIALGPWSPPAAVLVAATGVDEDDATLSSNALEMIFSLSSGNGKDLFYTSRTAIGQPWAPVAKAPFNGGSNTETPRFSGDDLTLFFSSDRGTSGSLDIFAVTRPAAGSNTGWGPVKPVGTVNTGADEKWFAPCGTDRYVMVQSRTNTGTDLVEGTIGGATAAPLDVLNSASNETSAFLTEDCLTIYFASNRTNRVRIYVSHRTAIGQPWQPPATVDDFKIGAGTDNQEDPWLSPDGRTFAFASDASGSKDVYLSTR